MASVISNWWGNAILQRYLSNGTVWVALHTGDPGVNNDATTEVTGDGYIRQSIEFGDSSAKGVTSTTKVVFSALPECVVTYYSLQTAQVGGNMFCSVELGTPISIAASGQLVIPAGDIAVGL